MVLSNLTSSNMDVESRTITTMGDTLGKPLGCEDSSPGGKWAVVMLANKLNGLGGIVL